MPPKSLLMQRTVSNITVCANSTYKNGIFILSPYKNEHTPFLYFVFRHSHLSVKVLIKIQRLKWVYKLHYTINFDSIELLFFS